jgi:WD repeat-containing protein 6
VTALEFYRSLGNRLLLVGEGVYLKVFEAETSTLITQCRVFDSQIIHGFAIKSLAHLQPGGDLGLAIWGGRSFVLLDFSTIEAVVSRDVRSLVSLESTAPDWILNGAISPFSTPQACVFVTAHCALLHASFLGRGQHPRLGHLSSLSQSILYSAHALWTSATAVLVAAGTVFGEIEVIEGHLASEERGAASRHLVTFTGHEGSVFGVQISPEMVDLDGRSTRLLASCSDDRTIRVWDVPAHLCEENLSSDTVGTGAPLQETGFLANRDRLETGKLTKRNVAAVMGHASRIWRVLFLASNDGAPVPYTAVNILSFGEDATCQQWSLDKCGTEAMLTHVNTFSYHSGKNIWSVALLLDGGNRYYLTTGGADGKVSLYNIHPADTRLPKAMRTSEFHTTKAEDIAEASSSTLARVECLTLEEILSGHPACDSALSGNHSAWFRVPVQKEVNTLIQKKNPQDALNRHCFVAKDKLLITTSFGKVLIGSIMYPHSWLELKGPSSMHQDLKSYSVVLGIPQCNTAILAGASGAIYMYHHGEEVKRIHKTYNKVAALFDVSKHNANSLCVLITTLGIAEAQLLSVQPPMSPDLIPNIVFKLTLPPKFTVTSAGYIRGLLVLGSRNGSLAVYDHVSSNEPLLTFYDENSKRDDAITTVINIPSISSSITNCHLLVTSRNGSYSIFSLSSAQAPHSPNNPVKRISLTLVHQSVPPLGPMIEAAWFHDSSLMLYGFRSKNFIVWNESKHCEVTSVECGGSHRSYAYSPIPGGDGAGHFAYTKASKLCLHSQSRASHKVTKRGGHGREIKACAVLESGKQKLIATGSEDTTIRIWSLKDGQLQSGGQKHSFQCHNVIEKHTTGIQHLQWCRYQDHDDGPHYLFSSGGNEEFYVWAVSPIPNFGLGVVCEATLTYQSEGRDLRIMNFDAVLITTQETASQIPESKFRLALAYSDSTINIYEYSRAGGFRKLAHSCYTSNCLTQVASLGAEDWHGLLFTTATDGYLAFWEFRSSHHSSSDTDPRPVSPSGLGAPASTTSLEPGLLPPPEASPKIEIPELKLLSRTRLHQSSVSAFDILPLPSKSPPSPNRIRGSYIIATGGDDNSLSLALFRQHILAQQVVVPSAHAAAITGVGFINGDHGVCEEVDRSLEVDGHGRRWHGCKLVTVGADQRVKLWRVELLCSGRGEEAQEVDTRIIRISKMKEGDNVWCSVADAAGLVMFRMSPKDNHCLVYGAGMEMFSVVLIRSE